MIDFKEQILPRLILLLTIVPIYIAFCWFFSFLFEPTPQELWQQKADELTVITSDSEIAEALAGEPRPYLVKNYKFNGGSPIKDTVFHLLTGDYLFIQIQEQVFTITKASSDSKIENWRERGTLSLIGGFALNNGVEIRNADSLEFVFSRHRYWQNLTPEYIDPQKLGHVQQDMYYYPDRTMNLDSIGAIIDELPERFEKSVEQTVEQFGKMRKEYDSRYTLHFLRTDDVATFAVMLGGGVADFKVFDEGGNYMLVDCDNMSQYSDYQTNTSLGFKIGMIFIGVVILLALIFAPKLFE